MPEIGERMIGTVETINGDFGYIRSEQVPDKLVYFKLEWCKDGGPLGVGDAVSFQLREYPNGLVSTAGLRRQSSQSEPIPVRSLDPSPSGKRILEWAYLGHLPTVLNNLRDAALPERWDFKNSVVDPKRPFPILYSYLIHTFDRLSLKDQILVNTDAGYAAFNTGLVDKRYEPIFALFVPSRDSRAYWKLSDFCTEGEGKNGQELVRHFKALPDRAHYFEDRSELIYDVQTREPSADWGHIIVDNIERFPVEFIEDNLPPGFSSNGLRTAQGEDRNDYFTRLGHAIQASGRTYRTYIRAVKEAVVLSIKRVSWNFKTAIPQYYPPVRKLQLLLPICLVSDIRVDLALAVERTSSGSYLGHTVLHLDWAYQNARLICRPDSDWLDPKEIDQGNEDDPSD